MEIVLFHPQIPPNTGTVARLCAATDTKLHLIEPLGFSLDDKHLKRAGLDYWPWVRFSVWPDWEAFEQHVGGDVRIVMTSVRGSMPYHDFQFEKSDVLVFGPETEGLPKDMLARYEHVIRIPIWGKVRSLNMANAASLLLYEGFRQTGILQGK